jgi:hypothetical protein
MMQITNDWRDPDWNFLHDFAADILRAQQTRLLAVKHMILLSAPKRCGLAMATHIQRRDAQGHERDTSTSLYNT